MYLLTKYMKYSHWVVVVLASCIWDRRWLEVAFWHSNNPVDSAVLGRRWFL